MPTVPIARALAEIGCSVVYVTSAVLAACLREQGFHAEAFDSEGAQRNPAEFLAKTAVYEIVNSGRSFWQQFGHGTVRASFIENGIRKVAQIARPSLILIDHLFFRNHRSFAGWSADGVPVMHVATSMPRWDEIGEDSEVPRWVLCPADFELDCFLAGYRNTTFCEPSIDWRRCEIEFTHVGARPASPLILYAPGTQVMMQTNADERLAMVVEVASRLSQCDFLIATGTQKSPQRWARLPDNVMIVSHLPQLALLRRAAVLITHGGLGSLKEAMSCGVPVVTMPAVFDQPYNAMRVRKKGLGHSIFPEKLSPQNLQWALESVLDSQAIRSSVACMRELFLDEERRHPFLNLVKRRVLGVSD